MAKAATGLWAAAGFKHRAISHHHAIFVRGVGEIFYSDHSHCSPPDDMESKISFNEFLHSEIANLI